MVWSFQVARVANIPIRVHVTFIALLLWIFGSGLSSRNLTPAFVALGLFVCVVLHELGHALAARRFGIEVRHITLLPIGGVASMDRIPRDPNQELIVAIAGPAVNFVLGPLLLLLHSVAHGGNFPDPIRIWNDPQSLVGKLGWLNVSLGLFNLIPAFPMDGGRVLRAFLAKHEPYAVATHRAARLGQFIALGFALLGLQGSPVLIFIALFIFVGAGEEDARTESSALLTAVKVREATEWEYQSLSPSNTLDDAVRLLVSGFQHDFPVVQGDEVVGVLTRDHLYEVIGSGGGARLVGDVMTEPPPMVDEFDDLTAVLEMVAGSGHVLVAVRRQGRVEGLLTRSNLQEFVTIAALRAHAPHVPVKDRWGRTGKSLGG